MSEQVPEMILDPAADDVARAIQDTMALLAPHWGTTAKTWDELGADTVTGGAWCRHLLRSAVTQLIRDGVFTPVSRNALALLVDDWDAQAAAIERDHLSGAYIGQSSRGLRECARQLRDRLGS